MIKVIAFDLVGVLVREKDIPLSSIEDRIERLFGDNMSDEEFVAQARTIDPNDQDLLLTATNIINKLYEVREPQTISALKASDPDLLLVVASNHVTKVREYISSSFKDIDQIFISAEINKIKPNADFYQHLLDSLNINPEELLFLDDNQNNIDGATKLGIETIKVNRDTNLFTEINDYLCQQRVL